MVVLGSGCCWLRESLSPWSLHPVSDVGLTSMIVNSACCYQGPKTDTHMGPMELCERREYSESQGCSLFPWGPSAVHFVH